MKKIFLLTGVGMILFSFCLFNNQDGIINALKAGNVEQVATYFDTFIDLTLPGRDEIKNMDKHHATIVLKSFFEENGINGFEPISQREAGAIMYMTGKLQGKSKSYNLTLLLKNKDGKHQIISVRIN